MGLLDQYGIRGVLLDMDDTLYMERDYVRSGFEAVGRAVGNGAFGAKCYDLFLEGVRGNTFDRALSLFPSIGMTVGEMVAIYRSHRPTIALCPDAGQFLTTTRRRLGVISDGPLESQRAKMRALGILPWIECPIFTQELGVTKPSEAPYQLAAYAFNLPYARCVYIGDNPHKDFGGAHALGMMTVRIRREGGIHAAEATEGDDVTCEIATMEAL